MSPDRQGRAEVDRPAAETPSRRRAVEAAQMRTIERTTRVEMMRGYAETDDCRRQFLLGYFGEDLVETCGSCDTCTAGTAPPLLRRRGLVSYRRHYGR